MAGSEAEDDARTKAEIVLVVVHAVVEERQVFPSELSPDRYISDPVFIDDLNAWIIYSDQGPRFDVHGQRLESSGALSTKDGGKTIQIISPPAVKKSVPISNTPTKLR